MSNYRYRAVFINEEAIIETTNFKQLFKMATRWLMNNYSDDLRGNEICGFYVDDKPAGIYLMRSYFEQSDMYEILIARENRNDMQVLRVVEITE